jgi:hypothetical protein
MADPATIDPDLVPDHPANIEFADETEVLDIPLSQRRFHGETVTTMKDHLRLSHQQLRLWNLMIDGRWRTVQEISLEIHDPELSISAQLRNLRKLGHGSHGTPKRRREGSNLWEYRLIPNPTGRRPGPLPKGGAFAQWIRQEDKIHGR